MKPKILWIAMGGVCLLGLIVAVSSGAFLNEAQRSEPVEMANVEVVQRFPHDSAAFTQGLAIEGETVFEGTGRYGASSMRRVDLKTGKVEKYQTLDQRFFGEGVTVIGDRIYQLTWKERVCVVFEKDSLKYLESLPYSGEGWGLADDEEHLYLSDGSSTIRMMHPDNLRRVVRRIPVREGRRRVDKLNELEWVDGELWANIWYSDQIVRIDPESGQVLGRINCSNIYPKSRRPDKEHVLNGIAYDAETKSLYLTGKNWPELFQVRVVQP